MPAGNISAVQGRRAIEVYAADKVLCLWLLGSSVVSTEIFCRVIATFKSNDTDMFKLIPSLAQSYPATYRRLYEGKALTCASTGMTFDATPVPTAIIMDVSHQFTRTGRFTDRLPYSFSPYLRSMQPVP